MEKMRIELKLVWPNPEIGRKNYFNSASACFLAASV